MPADAEPGGFYGSLLTQVISEDVEVGPGEIVPSSKVISRIGTLFFVTTPGDIKYQTELTEFSTIGHKRFFYRDSRWFQHKN